MIKSRKRVFVGTLYCGENEFARCSEALQSQTIPGIVHEVFEFLPNETAHQTLYRRFMDLRDHFDIFIKLDADMVFSRNDSIERMLGEFHRMEELDHAIFPVYDWYTQWPMRGIHAFKNSAVWETSPERLFVDPHPTVKGIRRAFPASFSKLVDHNPDPDPAFAWAFGAHRALKVVQRGRWKKRVGPAEDQLRCLKRVWELTRADNDPRRRLVIEGAESVFKGSTAAMARKGEWISDLSDRLPDVSEPGFTKRHQSKWEGFEFTLSYLYRVGFVKYGLFMPYQTLKTRARTALESGGAGVVIDDFVPPWS